MVAGRPDEDLVVTLRDSLQKVDRRILPSNETLPPGLAQSLPEKSGLCLDFLPLAMRTRNSFIASATRAYFFARVDAGSRLVF